MCKPKFDNNKNPRAQQSAESDALALRLIYAGGGPMLSLETSLVISLVIPSKPIALGPLSGAGVDGLALLRGKPGREARGRDLAPGLASAYRLPVRSSQALVLG